MNTQMQDASPNSNPSPKHWSDLLEKVGRSQDEDAFAALHTHFSPLIRGFLQAHGGGMALETSEELVQEVMVKVWLKAHSYDSSKAAASTWIFTLTRNARIDFLRKHARQDAQTDPLTTEDIWDEDDGSQPYIYLHQSRTEKQVAHLLKTLPSEQRQCLQKVYMEGKSHTEIASELELPLGTVKSRVRLGLKRLQATIDVN